MPEAWVASLPATVGPDFRHTHRRRTYILPRTGAAVGAGVGLYLTFQPRPLWWLAPLSFALLGLVLRRQHARAAFGYGLLAGLGFSVPLLAWTREFVGLLPWLLPAALLAGIVASACAGVAAVCRQ